MINQNFVIVGVLLQFFGGLSYLVDTLNGKIKPNKVSWFLWSLAPLTAFVGEIKQGVGIQSLATFIIGFVPLLIFIASFVNRKAEWKINRLDIICGILSIAGLILWYITRVGNIAILFGIIADALAYIPTLTKAYYYPETENPNVYIFGVANAGIALLTIQNWNFANFGFLLYILIFDSMKMFLTW